MGARSPLARGRPSLSLPVSFSWKTAIKDNLPAHGGVGPVCRCSQPTCTTVSVWNASRPVSSGCVLSLFGPWFACVCRAEYKCRRPASHDKPATPSRFYFWPCRCSAALIFYLLFAKKKKRSVSCLGDVAFYAVFFSFVCKKKVHVKMGGCLQSLSPGGLLSK